MRQQTIRPVFLVAGFLVWSSCFVVLYGANALGCELGWPDAAIGPLSLQRIVLVAIWVGHIAAFVPLIRLVRRSRSGAGDHHWPARPADWFTTAAAFAATIWIGIPTMVVTECV